MKDLYKGHNRDNNDGQAHSHALKPYYVAGFVLLTIIIIKTYAYAVSGSSSMLASLVDSLGDIVISGFAFFSIRMSLKPADHEHRFGHGKAEGFSALMQACFLSGAAVFLVFEAVHKLFTHEVVTHHGVGVAVSLLSIVLTLVIVNAQKKAYAVAPSLALKADQFHYTSDVVLNCAVILAFLIDWYCGFVYADQLISIAIAAYILRTVKHIGGDAVNMLMDREIEQEDRQKIIDIATAREDVHGIHDLRTRKSGMSIYISFDVELDGGLSLEDAHAITRELDLQLLAVFPNAEIIIHKDPVGDIYDPRHRVAGVHH